MRYARGHKLQRFDASGPSVLYISLFCGLALARVKCSGVSQNKILKANIKGKTLAKKGLVEIVN